MVSHCSKQTSKMSRASSSFRALVGVVVVACLAAAILATLKVAHGARMIRLCIASVDPAKLSSQCVMCNRREFPLTTIDCTGITKVNDLISNPLSVQAATCLIFNCRRQVPDIKPEPYHGSVTHAARANYPSASGARPYEVLPPTASMFGGTGGGYYGPPYLARPSMQSGMAGSTATQSSLLPGSLVSGGGSSLATANQQVLPYALIPAPFPFSARKYKAALVPLFRK